MSRKKILIADDHPIVLDGLVKLLESEYEVVATAKDGHELVKSALDLKPDVIVSDMSMPGLNGAEALRQIRASGSGAKFIMLTMHDEPEYAVEAFEIGAAGYVLKNSATTELQIAICETLAGNIYIAPAIAKDVFELMRSTANKTNDKASELNERQIEVLRYLLKGLSAKEIAKQIGVARKTVEYHKYKAMKILNIKTTAELIEYSVKNKLADKS
jgi:DNA-binding NarL/FixJ family response regulator